MTSSCIRLVWQPIQHKDRQRAESGETDSWVAANRQGGPTNAYGRYHHLRDVDGAVVYRATVWATTWGHALQASLFG